MERSHTNGNNSRIRQHLRRIPRFVEGAVVGAALVVIAASVSTLWVLAFDSELGEEWTSGLRPVQFYREFEAELLDDYAEVFAVAHNSGDEVAATLDAVAAGADVIEVDVIAIDGQLYAAHGSPPFWIGESFFRGPPLSRVWAASAGADAIKLDLKGSSTSFLEAVFRFLEVRRGQRMVIVVSGDPDVLRSFASREPEVYRFYGIGNDNRYRLLEEDPHFAEIVDGVSIRHSLLDEDRAAWLQERDILTLAWTVNTLERVNELVALGVDAVTTDNLAIMGLLGGQQRGERRLARLRDDIGPLESPISWVDAPVNASARSWRPPTQAQSQWRARQGRSTKRELRLPTRAGEVQPGRSSPRRTA